MQVFNKGNAYLFRERDLHRNGTRHASFCEVGQESPGSNTRIQGHIEVEQLAVPIRLELEDFATHYALAADVLLRYGGWCA